MRDYECGCDYECVRVRDDECVGVMMSVFSGSITIIDPKLSCLKSQ